MGSRFKRQLAELMEALHHMEPHYIRCIKPNGKNRCATLSCAGPLQEYVRVCLCMCSNAYPHVPTCACSRMHAHVRVR